MKFLLILFLLFSLPMNNKISGEVSARSYVVMEQSSGEVLEGKDIYLTRSVASISKISIVLSLLCFSIIIILYFYFFVKGF